MKRIFSAILALAIIVCFSTSAFAMEGAWMGSTYELLVSVSDVREVEGEKLVDASFYAKQLTSAGADSTDDILLTGGMAAVTLEFTYDAAVTYKSAVAGYGLATGASELVVDETAKSVKYLPNQTADLTITPDTAILTVTFAIPAEAEAGSYTLLTLADEPFMLTDGMGNMVGKSLGSLTVPTDAITYTVEGADPDPVVKDATVEEITEEGWVWTDATAYKVSTTVEGTVTEVSCALNASYTKDGNSTSKQIYSADLAGIYATEGSTISFRPILLGTDTISDLVVTGTFTLK